MLSLLLYLKKIVKNDLRTSQVLLSLCEEVMQEKQITLEKLVKSLNHRVYGMGILIFSLPSLVPLSIIPGVAAFFSLPIILLSLQLIFSKKVPWLPKRLKNKAIQTDLLKKIFNYSIPYLQKIEQIIKPRYHFFSSKSIEILVGILLTWLSILLILPIPLSNMLFGSLISLLAIGLIEKDGLVLLIGIILGSITITLYINVFLLLLNWLF